MTLIQDVRRQRIVESAIDCLATAGWHGTTLAKIAQGAGISRGLISYHFTGRDNLYEAVLETVVDTVFGAGTQAMAPMLEAEPTAVGKLRAYIRQNLLFMSQHRREMAALNEIFLNFRRPDGSLRFDTADEEPIIAGTAALFEFGHSTGEFGLVDFRTQAYFLRRCIDAAAHRIAGEPDFDVTAYADELTTLFLRGVSP